MCSAQSIAPAYKEEVHLSIELDKEDDGRWIAEALELSGVMTYGVMREKAISNTEKLAIEVIADRIRHGELPPSSLNVSFHECPDCGERVFDREAMRRIESRSPAFVKPARRTA